MKAGKWVIPVMMVLSLLVCAGSAGAVTFQQVPTGGSQPAVTGQSNDSALSAEGGGGVVKDTSPLMSRSAANQVGMAYREMALSVVEAHVDLSNFIYADPDRTSEKEMEVRYDRCMKSLNDLEKKAKRVDQAVDMALIASSFSVREEMACLLNLLRAEPAYAGYAPGTARYGVNQRGILYPLKKMSQKVSQRVSALKKSLPSSRVDTRAVREQVGRWLAAAKGAAGVVAGGATFLAGAALAVTATPLGLAVGLPLAAGGVLGGMDAILTCTEDMQSVSEEDLDYEMMPSDSDVRKDIAAGAKAGNYLGLGVTGVTAKSAGEMVTGVLQAPGEASEFGKVLGDGLSRLVTGLFSFGLGAADPGAEGTGISGGTADISQPVVEGPGMMNPMAYDYEPPLCPGYYIDTPGMVPGRIDFPTPAYKKMSDAMKGFRPDFGNGPDGKNWWDSMKKGTETLQRDGGGGEGGGGGGCGCGH